jgi:predicted alpha/beta superfamily hydrolase
VAPKPKQSTASRQVQVLDTAFYIPKLNRTRRVWIYLPEDYTTDLSIHYPVLYMHDGQNLFEDTTSYSGEWGVDEYLDSIKMKKCIVVGIDHGGEKRMNEYSPFNHEEFGKGEGAAYVDFVAKKLKPFIDKKFRTIRNRQHTFIAGSSMGGLISMYAVLRHPRVFGGAGVFSPSFWVSDEINQYIRKRGKKYKGLVYFYAGKQEGEQMVQQLLKGFEILSSVSKAKSTVVIRNDGMHNETTWRKEFPLFYQWVMSKQ